MHLYIRGAHAIFHTDCANELKSTTVEESLDFAWYVPQQVEASDVGEANAGPARADCDWSHPCSLAGDVRHIDLRLSLLLYHCSCFLQHVSGPCNG